MMKFINIDTAFNGGNTETAKERDTIVYGPKIGMTLYTVRNEYNAMRETHLAAGKDEKAAATAALTETLERIAAMGYTAYQPNHTNTNWFLMDAAELRNLNQKLGLRVISPHMLTAWNLGEKELDDFLSYLVEIGADGISLDWTTPPGFVKGEPVTQTMMNIWLEDTYRKLIFMQERIAKNNFTLEVGFHAHSMEWIPVESFGGRYVLDILYERMGRNVLWHFDTSHAVWPEIGLNSYFPYTNLGEEGMIKYLWTHGDQYRMIHAKDVDCEGYYTTACGQGDLKWNRILRALVHHKIEWLFVEDNSPIACNRDGFGSVQVSIDYFRELYISLGLTHP